MRNKYDLRASTILVIFSIIPQFQISQVSERVSTHEILSNPARYDGQEITCWVVN